MGIEVRGIMNRTMETRLAPLEGRRGDPMDDISDESLAEIVDALQAGREPEGLTLADADALQRYIATLPAP
jgi:hypothetical protein